jgi:hypothetical protein
MGTKNNPGDYDCYEKAEPDEPIFVLLGRDSRASGLVMQWAAYESGRADGDPAKVAEAEACAKAMRQWYADHR